MTHIAPDSLLAIRIAVTPGAVLDREYFLGVADVIEQTHATYKLVGVIDLYGHPVVYFAQTAP